MKKYLTLFTTGIILILSSCATNSDIDNLQHQIDGLKSGQIATIESQINSITASITSLQEADREIKGYIAALQSTALELQKSINSADGKIDDLEKALVLVNTAIENLKAKDSALEQRITDLKDYVDTQLRGAKDWVSATFATLEQYNGIVSEIGGIKGSISSINTAMQQMESRLNGKITLMKGEIEEAYTKAIGALESSLKNWVNEQLEGYWTIAETEGKLETLEGNLAKEDESIREDIGKLRSSLDSAKTELTEGYKAAIKKAIEENNGVLDGKLSEAVSGLNTRIDGEVSTINERIDGIEKRVASLEAQVTALVSRIQSLSYIPRYIDGASTMWLKTLSDGSIEARDTLDFRVSPADCADALVKVWENAVSAEAVSLLTRSSQVTAALPVVSVTGGDGKISVVLDGSSLSDDFYAGEQQMRVVVIISDGNNERTSEYIPMFAKEIKSIIEVESVTINPQLTDLVIGETLQLSATVLPSDASDKTVIWSSSDNQIATVDESGEVTAIKEGSAIITAKAGDKTATCSVTVKAKVISVTGVTLDKTSLTMIEGDTQTLTATITPSNATDKSVTWSSSAPSVAEVSSSGVVIARSEGSATITVKTKDGGKTASCSVVVNKIVIPVSSISLNKTSLSLTKGQSETLTATISPSDATDKTITWSSSNTAVATVDQNGKVSAVGGGSATITAKAGDKQVTCTVTVTVPVNSVSLDRTSVELTEGGSTTLVATVKPDDATDKEVTWSSANTSVATVDQNGKVTAIKEGTTTILAKAGDITATCSVNVNKIVIPVSFVTLNKTSLDLVKGQSETLTATVKPDDATDKKVTWSSSNSSVATVDQNGKVTAIAGGSATITAKASDKQVTCAVTVTVPVSSVTLDKTELTIEKGKNETLKATVSPSDATDKTVSWKSSNNSVATVDQDGKVTGVGAGSAVITVTTEDGSKTATCDVTVVIPVTSVTLNKTELTIEKGKSETLTATVNPSDASDKTVTWTTSDASIATVSNGVVTAKNVGTATITAKAGDKSATCVITVSDPQTEIVGEEEGEW